MKNKVTVVIPTHERHHLLEKRVLPHYRDFGIPILVIDSSREPSEVAMKDPAVDYVHCPGAPFPHKIKEPLLDRVGTPYMFMCADDTVHSLDGVRQCVEYMESEMDYASVMGQMFECQYPDKSIVYGYDFDILSMPIDSDEAGERMLQIFIKFRSIFYAVVRTETWKDIFRRLPGDMVNYYLAETYVELMMTASGKHATLPFLYGVTEAGPAINDRDPRYHCSPFKLGTQPRYAGEVASMKQAVMDYLIDLSGISEERARIYVNGALALYWLQDKPIKTMKDRLRNEWRNLLNKTVNKAAHKAHKAEERKVKQTMLRESTRNCLNLIGDAGKQEYDKLVAIIQNT